MRLAGFAAVLLAAFASGGCLVLTLQPIYDEPAIEFDEKLLGTWENAEDGASAVVARGTWRSYDVSYTGGGGAVKLTAFATRIGGSRFLDLAPERGASATPLLVPAHAFCRIQLLGDTLTVTPLEYDWSMRALDQAPRTLRFAIDSRNNLLITSPTSVVREWILTTLKAAGAYGEPMTFVRRRQGGAAGPPVASP
jgi:hypothetical protein